MYRRAFSSLSLAQRAAASLSPASGIAVLPRAAAVAASSSSSGVSRARHLSSSIARRSHGESDSALSSKLSSELQYEQENVASEASGSEPEFLSTFKSAGIWSIEDRAGADEVALTRKFGNESIKLLFSIADIDNGPAANAMAEDDAAGEQDQAETEAVDSQGQSLPIRCAITISKAKSQGALTIDAVAQDGMFLVDNISLYNDESLALDLTSEADWKRRGLYMGPAFDHLDESLQTEFESFLEERGIDSNLALFIPDLAEYKEQKEYVKWLDGVKKFIDA